MISALTSEHEDVIAISKLKFGNFCSKLEEGSHFVRSLFSKVASSDSLRVPKPVTECPQFLPRDCLH